MPLIHDLFLWIYVRPIPQLLAMLIGASALFLFARRAWGNRPVWKLALLFGLTLWAAVVFCITVSGRNAYNAVTHSLVPFHSYWELINGGNPEILRSNFMNIALFYPAGLAFMSLLPRQLSSWCRILLTLALFAVLSSGIEYCQYAGALGNAEADDVIHNTLGAFLGSLLVLIPLGKISRT